MAQSRTLTLIVLFLGNFFVAVSYSLQAPFFPKEAEAKGLTPSQYGLVFGIFQLTVFVFSPVVGKLVAIYQPKLFIDLGILVTGISSLIFGILDMAPYGNPFFWLTLSTRVVEGIGTAAFQTASFTIIAAVFPDKVATMFAIIETSSGLGLIAGPTLGGLLYQLGGFITPFETVGGLLIVCAIVTFFFLPPIENKIENKKSGNLLKFWLNLGTILNASAILGTFFFIGFNVTTLEPHLRQFSLRPAILGTLFVLGGAMYAVTAPLFGYLADRKCNSKLMSLLGICLLIVSSILIGPAPYINFETKLWTVILSLLIYGLGIAAILVSAFTGTLQDTLNRGFPDDLSTYGLVSSLFSSSQSLGAFIGPTIGGVILEKMGYRESTVVISIVMAFLGILLMMFLIKEAICPTTKAKTEISPLVATIP